MKRYTVFASLLVLVLLSACNTMEGFGQDVERAGDNIEDSARKSK